MPRPEDFVLDDRDNLGVKGRAVARRRGNFFASESLPTAFSHQLVLSHGTPPGPGGEAQAFRLSRVLPPCPIDGLGGRS
jgi:hypothetical protein